ncbi:MAG: alpha-galactosidase [Victivallales bacterium]|nr:alpha-galactosidase [Victivallales bacterium]
MNFTVCNENGEQLAILSTGEVVDGKLMAQAGKVVIIRTEIPYAGTVSYWTPDIPYFAQPRLPWREEFTCGANRNFPVWVQLDHESRACGAVGITNCIDDCLVQAAMNQETGMCEITFTAAVTKWSRPFALWGVEVGECITLMEVLRNYRNAVGAEVPESFPKDAWNPVYCTWYAVHAALTGEYLRQNAAAARELGFGTFIVDDGWCIDAAKRVNPVTIQDWYNAVGDWEVSQAKLPEMSAVVKEARDAGWKYLFWTAPLMVGRCSALNQLVSKFKNQLHEGYRLMSPDDEAGKRSVIQALSRAMEEYDLDGLKVDFLDELRPDPWNPICGQVYEYIVELVNAVRKIKPQALIEFRQKYAVPQLAGLATAFRAGDVPFAFAQNYLLCLHLRMMMGDGMPIHADPVYFRNDDSPETVARHMICSLAGVPMLSMELASLSESARKIIRHWLQVYREWQEVLNFGKWTILPQFGFVPWCTASANGRTVIFLWKTEYLETALRNADGSFVIFNLSDEKLALPGCTGRDCFGNPSEGAPPGGLLQGNTSLLK